MATRTISITQWCEMARDGAAPPVTICLEGESMRPLIRKGRDPVTIVPMQRPPRVGDVVLFTLGDGRYVVHRVWKTADGWVRTLGDHCLNPEPWFPTEQVLGQVIQFRRCGKAFPLDTAMARFWGRCWMATHRVRRAVRVNGARVKHGCKRVLESIAGGR